MLTLTDAWKNAALSGKRPVVIAQITLSLTETVAFSSAQSPIIEYGINSIIQNNLISVTQIALAMDPLTRKTKGSTLSFRVADTGAGSSVRATIKNYRLKSKGVSIELGFEGIPRADFKVMWRGFIEEYLPFEGGVEFRCVDALTLLGTLKFKGDWINQHPLEVIKNLILYTGLPSGYIDSTSFDPATYVDYIGHYNLIAGMEYYGAQAFTTPEPVWNLVDEVGQILVGGVVWSSDGKAKFLKYTEPTQSNVSKRFTKNEVSEFRVKKIYDNLFNEFAIKFDQSSDGKDQVMLGQSNGTSKVDYGFASLGGGDRIVNYEIKTRWLSGAVNFKGKIVGGVTQNLAAGDGDGTDIVVSGIIGGLCGLRDSYPTASKPASAQLSANQKLLLGLYNIVPGESRQNFELIECRAANFDDQFRFVNPEDGGIYHSEATLTIAARGLYGTTARTWKAPQNTTGASEKAFGVDCTIAMDCIKTLIKRFANGTPVIEFRLPLIHYDLEVGDFVTLKHDVYASIGYESLTDDDIFEITKKEVSWTGPEPAVSIEATWAANAALPAGSGVYNPLRQYTSGKDRFNEHNFTRIRHFVQNGLNASAGAGFNLDIAPGVCGTGDSMTGIAATKTLVMSASKDNYVYFDPSRKNFVIRSVTLGGTKPTLDDGMIEIAKAVTNGAGITSVTDLRDRPGEPIIGNRVKYNTIGNYQRINNTEDVGINPNPVFTVYSKG